MEKVFFILIAQAVGDHIFQGPGLKKRKQTSLAYLLAHTGLYSIALLPLSFFLLGFEPKTALYYFAVNIVLHGLVDLGTGKLKTAYWSKNESVYFSIAAIDQIVHIALMLITWVYFTTGSFNLTGLL